MVSYLVRILLSTIMVLTMVPAHAQNRDLPSTEKPEVTALYNRLTETTKNPPSAFLRGFWYADAMIAAVQATTILAEYGLRMSFSQAALFSFFAGRSLYQLLILNRPIEDIVISADEVLEIELNRTSRRALNLAQRYLIQVIGTRALGSLLGLGVDVMAIALAPLIFKTYRGERKASFNAKLFVMAGGVNIGMGLIELIVLGSVDPAVALMQQRLGLLIGGRR